MNRINLGKLLICIGLVLGAIFIVSPDQLWAQSINMGICGNLRITKDIKTYKEIKSEHVEKQSLDYSCGPAALATIMKWGFQDEINEKEIITQLLQTSNLEKIKKRGGFSLLDLKSFAQSKGYKVTGYRMDLEFLVALKRPVLVPIKIKTYEHFVIFRGIGEGRVFVSDPAMGNMSLEIPYFKKIWQDGIGLVVEKEGTIAVSGLTEIKPEELVFPDDKSKRQFMKIQNLGPLFSAGEF